MLRPSLLTPPVSVPLQPCPDHPGTLPAAAARSWKKAIMSWGSAKGDSAGQSAVLVTARTADGANDLITLQVDPGDHPPAAGT